jgi:hypothetical protein
MPAYPARSAKSIGAVACTGPSLAPKKTLEGLDRFDLAAMAMIADLHGRPEC